MTVLRAVVAVAGLLVSVRPSCAIENSVGPPAGLHEVWNEKMLAGTFGWIRDGKEEKSGFGRDSGKGWIHGVSRSPTGINVMDLRERRFLKSRGGWVLEGGLLGHVAVSDERMELYGKTIERHEPFASPWPHVWIGGDVWTFAHEFFLLRRRKPGDRAAIVRKWVVPDVRRDLLGSRLAPRGLIEYESSDATIVVKVMDGYGAGLFIERLDLSGTPVHRGNPHVGGSAPVVITRCPAATQNPERPLDPLDRLWETKMLNADFGWVRDGKPSTFIAHVPFTAADGWVNQALQTTEAIIVSAKDDTPIQGGLLRRATAGSATVELYAKQLRWGLDPNAYNKLVVWGGWGPAHEFFLLARANRDKKARILRQWKVPFDGPGRFFLRGFLTYDSALSIASVRITDGLDRTMVDDRVMLEDCRSEK